MSRPCKKRRVCSKPDYCRFAPQGVSKTKKPVVNMTVDEYETIRLIDYEKLNQEECAKRMGVARTTVQAIYCNARTKLAQYLIEGRFLYVDGGEYDLCEGKMAGCKCGHCRKNKLEVQEMKVAVTYENGSVFQHFGHTEQFKIYEIKDGTIISETVIDTNGSGHGALAGLLSGLQIDTLICGGIGGGARTALAQAGITLYGGVSGEADAAVRALIAGNLSYNPDVMCSHHGQEHHGNCGDGGCGNGHCGQH